MNQSGLSLRGFTLIELLTVIAIIGILAAILIPVVASVRDSARSALCQNNLRVIGQAAYLYAADHDDFLPPLGGAGVPNHLPSSWTRALAPYVADGRDFSALSYRESGGDTNLFCPQALQIHGGRLAPMVVQTYGYNRFVTSGHGSFPYLPRTAGGAFQPSQTLLFADGNWRDGRHEFDIRVDTGLLPTPVHGGGQRYYAVFMDGHVSGRTLAETPVNPADVFWDRERD